MVDQRWLYVYLLIPLTFIGVGASSYINGNFDPILFRVDHVELIETRNVEDQTFFTFETTSEIWNERYRDHRIRHATSCPIRTGIVSNVDGFTMLNQPICSSALEQTSTDIKPGLNIYPNIVTIVFEESLTYIPEGNYTFITYPKGEDLSGRYEYNSMGNGEIEITNITPNNWGEMKFLKTPLTWYLPSYGVLVLLIIQQLRLFYLEKNRNDIHLFRENNNQ